MAVQSCRRGKLRSVNSECEGRVIESRKNIDVGVLGVPFSGDSTEVPRGGETAFEVGLRHRQLGESRRKKKQQLPDIDRPQGLGTEARPGSESRANAHKDYPGTWETMPAPRRAKARAVPPRIGTTEATWEGRRGVIAAHTTDEAGEVYPSDPAEDEGAAESWNHLRERWQRHKALKPSQRNLNG